MARFELVREDMRRHNGEIKLPQRGSSCAGGYDFFAPCDETILPHTSKLIFTDVKACFEPNQELLLNVRSSQGVKNHVMLANTCGWIESDYFGNEDNDGNIGFCLYNYGDKPYEIKKGDKIGQGMLIHFDTFENGNTDEERVGGFGSTGV